MPRRNNRDRPLLEILRELTESLNTDIYDRNIYVGVPTDIPSPRQEQVPTLDYFEDYRNSISLEPVTLTQEMIEEAARRSAENFGVPDRQFSYGYNFSDYGLRSYSISNTHIHDMEYPTEGVAWCTTCGKVTSREDIVRAAMAQLGIS